MWWVYILKCFDDTLYTGISNNVEKRIKAHNEKRGAKYTKGRLPVILLCSIPCANKSEALRLEAKIKKLSRQEKLDLCCDCSFGKISHTCYFHAPLVIYND